MTQPKIFLPYTIALLAKQKGFDEPCHAYYHKKELKLLHNAETKGFARETESQVAPTYQNDMCDNPEFRCNCCADCRANCLGDI